MQNSTNISTFRVRVNGYIRVPQVRVILDDGSSPGVMPTRDALKMAQDQGLDLVEINPKAIPPVCKIIDYGKYKYDEKKKQNEAKKNQKIQELKEITLRPNTDQNDLNVKLESAKQFIIDGNKVKFTIRFRGREITHPEIGRQKLDWFVQELTGLIIPQPPMSLEGKFMSMVVTPGKQKA